MEQYLNLVWKNYTASLARNSDDENLSDEQDNGKTDRLFIFNFNIFFLSFRNQIHSLEVIFTIQFRFGSVSL